MNRITAPQLCVIPGDGIGQEVIPAAVAVLTAAIPHLQIVMAEAGWGTFEKVGVSVPEETLTAVRECGAGLFGAVSSPSHKVAGYRSAILAMRQELDLYANIRPVQSWPRVSPRLDVDMIIVRENTEGLYVGRERWEDGGDTAVAERLITRRASLRIAQKTLELMQRQNRHKLTIVHKANVLPLTDGLFRDSVREVFAGAGITVEELLVDVAALKMVAAPESFDVIVTTNLFGDILSDAAAHWGGGLGLAASLNWGDGVALAEPVHGSAPDIAGKGVANPIAAILSGALLARYVWGLEEGAGRVETAVARTLVHETYPQLTTTQAITHSILASL
ncbi:MAG: isocitrate/isopropylmalate dehydrogenase family protein [Chloroflexi bacterium]|nr:isocitrate/isopropylmalate dehydrogenase family protein [Ardenticatenaceae bacterium]MBL1128177.1 isocitrate/isopropylmalate dehydrogenase family protein [Chloroflexota bacterium]NOG34250.1 isocitrate/isopropylmalate dehydrogenase family protein [Chloroflexota bacterium]GIK56364.1 MAG: 3-isopropylmalate dehydrogenase [Chloroflexota bacterium]